MKKYIKLISGGISAAVLSAFLCACGNGGGLFAEPTPTPMPSADATVIISLEEALAAIENAYELELSDGGAVTEGNVSTASYYAVPKGSGDPVIVKVINRTESVSADDVWSGYEDGRISRSSSELVDGIGYDAYIAYPSIHVYDRGCEIVITASSGSDDKQKAILKSLAETAVANLENIMPEEEGAVE